MTFNNHGNLVTCNRKVRGQKANTVDPGYNQRQGNAIGVSYNRTFLYPGFNRNEIASRGLDTH